MSKTCLNCDAELVGRAGKKYCSDYCKSNYNYEKNKLKEDSLFKKIDNQLKLNRRLLKEFNRAGKATVRKEKIIEEGFDPNYFTHYWKNKKGDVYLFYSSIKLYKVFMNHFVRFALNLVF